MQPKCSQNSVNTQSKFSQNAAKMQSEWSQNAAKMQSKWSQNAARMEPKCSQNSVKLQQKFNQFLDCSWIEKFSVFLPWITGYKIDPNRTKMRENSPPWTIYNHYYPYSDAIFWIMATGDDEALALLTSIIFQGGATTETITFYIFIPSINKRQNSAFYSPKIRPKLNSAAGWSEKKKSFPILIDYTPCNLDRSCWPQLCFSEELWTFPDIFQHFSRSKLNILSIFILKFKGFKNAYF